MALSRSEQMSRIRGSNTSPEVALRAALESRGFQQNPDGRAPVGRPDLIFADARTAIFIDGCFWHGCPLHYARPRTRDDFWSAKLITNLERDALVSDALSEAGWTVIRVWEHEVVEDLDCVAELVAQALGPEATSSWRNQRRVRRVVETAERTERREFVLLGEPCNVVDAVEGPRVTAKARAQRRRGGLVQNFGDKD